MPSRGRMWIESLESRQLLAGIAEGQLFLYLLNEARNNPAAYQLAESLSVDLSGVAKRQPLAWNASLQQSSQFHSDEMATHNYFEHQSSVTGQWPNASARSYGYDLPSWFPNDDNYIESIGAGTLRTTAGAGLKGLILSAPHRDHLLGISDFNAVLKEAGIGYAQNASSTYTNYWTVHATRTQLGGTFLTGVVFDDLNGNGRYDLNEGSPGIAVTVGTSIATTNAAGGWSVAVTPNQRHSVSVQTAGGMISTAVDVGTDNRQVDFRGNSQTARLDFGTWQNSVDVMPPTATLSASLVSLRHQASHTLVVSYQDDVSFDAASLRTGNLNVLGPHGFQQIAELKTVEPSGTGWKASYEVDAPGGAWTNAHDGDYSVNILAGEIRDAGGNSTPAGVLGILRVQISTATYVEDVNDDSIVSPVDVLLVINHLNAAIDPGYRPFLDVSRDELISPVDVLLVINFLNLKGLGEGESPDSAANVDRNADRYFEEFYSSELESRYRKQRIEQQLLAELASDIAEKAADTGLLRS